MPRTRIRFCALLVPLALAGCRDAAAPYTPLPAAMRIAAGNAQVGEAATELVLPIKVKVLDGDGHAVRQQMVTFHVMAGGGSLYSGSALTDRDGVAQDRWTLGRSTADIQRVEARVVNAATGAVVPPVTFTATVAPGRGASLTPGPAHAAPVLGGTDTIVVRVTDRFGNPVPDVPVLWAADAGASVVAERAVTDAGGFATGFWMLPPRYDAVYRLTAIADTMSVSFTVRPGLPEAMVLEETSGDGQYLRVESPLAPLEATLRLSDGRPVQGVPVTWRWVQRLFQNSEHMVTVATGANGVSRLDPPANGHSTHEYLQAPDQQSWYQIQASAPGGARAYFNYHLSPGPAWWINAFTYDPIRLDYRWPPVWAVAKQTLWVGIWAPDKALNFPLGDTLYLTVLSGGGSVSSAAVEIQGGCWTREACYTWATWTLGPAAGQNVLEIRTAAGDVRWRGSVTSQPTPPPSPPD